MAARTGHGSVRGPAWLLIPPVAPSSVHSGWSPQQEACEWNTQTKLHPNGEKRSESNIPCAVRPVFLFLQPLSHHEMWQEEWRTRSDSQSLEARGGPQRRSRASSQESPCLCKDTETMCVNPAVLSCPHILRGAEFTCHGGECHLVPGPC